MKLLNCLTYTLCSLPSNSEHFLYKIHYSKHNLCSWLANFTYIIEAYLDFFFPVHVPAPTALNTFLEKNVQLRISSPLQAANLKHLSAEVQIARVHLKMTKLPLLSFPSHWTITATTALLTSAFLPVFSTRKKPLQVKGQKQRLICYVEPCFSWHTASKRCVAVSSHFPLRRRKRQVGSFFPRVLMDGTKLLWAVIPVCSSGAWELLFSAANGKNEDPWTFCHTCSHSKA